ncbi:hypothetical protein F5050DRAFT_1898792 [Lentinula boryana]|uniref:Uncharacterized protein n=1 Tax=Lentinula boryana TaxID=40481 RepID=A0ABQ8PX62_9AGAR|nr:hypothetical protein F5050DRAFT_1898792 [Lentinula boryana]
MPPRTRAALGTRKTRSNNVPDAEQTSLSSIDHPAKRNKRMVDTSEGKGRGKGKSRAVQKGKGKANGKREGEEASDGEIETEAAVKASALELEDSASRPPLQLPLRSLSQRGDDSDEAEWKLRRKRTDTDPNDKVIFIINTEK